MLPGLNTNIKYKGKIFHVQTEDMTPLIFTQVFLSGAILASNKSSYKDKLEITDHASIVKTMMQQQHKDMIKKLIAGNLQVPAAEQTDEPKASADTPKENFLELPEIKSGEKRKADDSGGTVDDESGGIDDIILDYMANSSDSDS